MCKNETIQSRRSTIVRRSSALSAALILTMLYGCGMYDPQPAQGLLFGVDPPPPTIAIPAPDHSKPAAIERLNQALTTPDRAAAEAFIRSAIGYLR